MASTIYVDSVTLSSAAEWNKWDTAAYAALSGVAGTNTITATGPANLTLVATNPVLWFIPAVTNTGATTLNITPSGGAALTAKNVFSGGAACTGGELVAGVPAAIAYDGTQFNILGSPAVTSAVTSSTFTFDGSGGSTGALNLTWQKQGQFVRLHIPSALATTGTGSVALTSNTAIAAAARPVTQQSFPTNEIRNNGAAISSPGVIIINTNGTIQILRDSAILAFTNTAQAGLNLGQTVTYFVG